ncbi:MAG: tRNA (N(6)-L-threonylcarbamoyladenosine(37)-C(2))-methylthiotransferase MtaB [Candidatus Aminicenantes bacterium]|nr:tRNA (N(6)-L-threonylcarbamoyladenosine(37)-C(2))-methylthiotransferase MtaB [Candidatus Aminicenantes bacterium]
MTSFSIQSFGCRVNQAEAFSWVDEFQKHGLKYEQDFFKSDLVLVNTCTLTSRADRDVRSFLNKTSRLNPNARLIVTGCFAERAADELKKFPQVWQVFSNQNKEDLPAKIISLIGPKAEDSRTSYRSRALVKIQDGCSLSCTFCIIPQVRGGCKSTRPDIILQKVKDYFEQGFQEIVLTGIHVCLYGSDFSPKLTLLYLLKKMEGLKKSGRIRLSSLDPRFMSEPLLEHLVASKQICSHFHFSLQHGSEEVLKRMGRRVKISDYDRILRFLREKRPHVSLGADIIVGFPGESDLEFEKMFQFLEKSPLTYFHVFPYSPRPGTEAKNWPPVNEKIKKERAAQLRQLSSEKNLNFRRLTTGMEWDAVVVKKGKQRTRVLTDNYIEVLVPSRLEGDKERVKVRITRVTEQQTFGQIL